ncbi:MAG: S8 family serine peptidase [Bdellovibrionaceae bacterium]|nr:S8 family serine peptidase [Bdellovibrio sp.]
MLLKGRGARLLISSLLLVSGSVFAGVVKQKKIEAVPGEYIVRLKTNVAKISKAQLSQALGSSIKSTIPRLNLVVVKRASFETKSSALQALKSNPLVAIAEPNFIYKINRTPNDPLLSQLWGMKNLGQVDSGGGVGVAGVDIDVEKAWDIETGSSKMIVAVIDTGIDFNHPDLKDNLWTNQAEAAGIAGIDDDGNGVIDDIHGYNAITGTGDATDDHGHGSHCAGTIGAKGNDEKGIVGVNWDVQLMAVKFLDANGSGNLEDALKAIDYASRMGAKVLSNSWGGGEFSETLFEVIKNSNKLGSIFVAAAGNDASNNDTSPSYPASFEVENVFVVGAINNKGIMADFSNFGKKTVHISAPGVNIYSSTGGAYDSWSGTSMATPHVSGVAALLWAHEPQLTSLEVMQRLMQTAKPLAGLKNKTKTGGMVSAYNALTNTVPPPDPNDTSNWESVAADYASAMPYLPNSKVTTDVTLVGVEGIKDMALYFEKFDTEGNYDTLTIFDANGNTVQVISGNYDDSFSAVIPGNSAKLVFTSDGSVEKGGWKITKIAFRK